MKNQSGDSWTAQRLAALVESGAKESLLLEFKGSDALSRAESSKANEISKDVSAFANSAGGTLIYGLVEEGHAAIKIDAGVDPAVISKEWLEQKINSNIQRRIDGLRVHQIDLQGDDAGRVAYVVEIPQSNQAPHQAFDKKFYKRFNFQSVPMEEYEIRDVARRAEAPDLVMRLEVIPQVDSEQKRETGFRLNAVMENRAPAMATHAIVAIYIDDDLSARKAPRFFSKGYSEFISHGELRRTARRHSYNHMPPTHMPIFEGVGFSLWDYPGFTFDVPERGNYLIGWRIHAPGMTTRGEVIQIRWDGVRFEVDAPVSGDR